MSSSFFTPDGAAYSSDRDNWETPQHLFDQLNAHYHFTIDVAANEQNPNALATIRKLMTGCLYRGRGIAYGATRRMGEG